LLLGDVAQVGALVHANYKTALKQTIVKVVFWIDTIPLLQ
jgi:hypothetical protein